jgi:hypothetical protein
MSTVERTDRQRMQPDKLCFMKGTYFSAQGGPYSCGLWWAQHSHLGFRLKKKLKMKIKATEIRPFVMRILNNLTLHIPGLQFMTPPRRRKPVGPFPDKPSSVAEKLRAVLPANNSKLRVFIVTDTYYCRSQWPCGLRHGSWSVGCWDRGFESRSRHGCLSFVFLCCVVLCR